MTHSAITPTPVLSRPGPLFALALALAVGFALGQVWPEPQDGISAVAPLQEDWHGNVKRSTWPD